jgi:hypothetical protein
MAGSMWKSETQETRDKYHAKAMTIKKALLSEMPNYKYTPRKPDEIQRRRRQIPLMQKGGERAVIAQEHEEVIRQLFPGSIGVITDRDQNSTHIYQKYGTSALRHTPISGWMPQVVTQSYAAQGLPLPLAGAINQAAVFGQVLPTIHFDEENPSPIHDTSMDVGDDEESIEDDGLDYPQQSDFADDPFLQQVLMKGI